MPIRPPAGAEIRALIRALDADDGVTRESAVARLAVIGPRAVEHLVRDYAGSGPRLRAGLLRALEASADPRGLTIARQALDDAAPEPHVAAASVLRALLSSDRADVAASALDALVAVAVDTGRPASARTAAIDALRDAPADVIDPIRRRLATDPDADVRARAAGATPSASLGAAAWQAAVAGQLPPTPQALKALLAAHRPTARLTELQHLVDHVRTREQNERDPGRREEWRVVRGAAHQALAARNSRLALYDLRDSLLEGDRLPIAFLAALEEIGDATCLETLAAAYDASSRSGDPWWREHVANAFRAIMQREGLTRRHAAVKRVSARYPETAGDLLGR